MTESPTQSLPADADYCYLTTTGRRTGTPHTIEIWFALQGQTLYLLSGGGHRSDWVRNLEHNPRVRIRLGERTFDAGARLVTDPSEDALVRRLLVDKYQPRYSGDLGDWGRTAVPVSITLSHHPD